MPVSADDVLTQEMPLVQRRSVRSHSTVRRARPPAAARRRSRLTTEPRPLVGGRARVRFSRLAWAAAVPLVIVLPLLLSSSAGYTGDFVLEMSLATGLLAASFLVIVTVSISRSRSLTKAFGIEQLIVSHRWFGILTMVMVLVHTALVILDDPGENLALVTWVHAPPRARNATVSTLAIVAICLFAMFRRKLRWPYEVWRWIHITLAVLALVTAGFHVYLLNHLIRNPVMRAWFVGIAAVVLMTLTRRWIVRPLLHHDRRYVVQQVVQESPVVSTLVLAPRHNWQPGLRFLPGQFAWIRFDSFRRPWEEHPFTIASSADRPREIEFTIRHVGDFTRGVGRLRVGAVVRLDGPYGDFTVDIRQKRPLLLIAGGVGVTPMMSILRTLAHRDDFRPAVLIMAARHERDLLFRAELRELSAHLPLRVIEVLSAPPEHWTGQRGRVDAGVLHTALPSRRERTETDVYICGSPPMVGGALAGLRRLRVPAHLIHTEQFDMI
ncbi:ferredoxin reductase family protein [Kineosporia succinea]|uniref:Ferric reductase n=1 Tax=Kineosporia succinea TaxID=84632 RepID=A0ABT9P8D3_9ACTN|nr:ferric reductase-like transmembrane domain-containing protein [Kineosporia succinea]MDP9828722.1 putative ferric reductase [Kineosporia succinea]